MRKSEIRISKSETISNYRNSSHCEERDCFARHCEARSAEAISRRARNRLRNLKNVIACLPDRQASPFGLAMTVFQCFLIVFILFLIFSPAYAQHEWHQAPSAKQAEKVKKTASTKAIYYCPMHPTYTSDRPGDCPICNMKLVKKEGPQDAQGAVKQTAGEKQGFYISPEKQQLIGVKTAKAVKRELKRQIRTVGRVAFDPELYKAQQEYLSALDTSGAVKDSGQESIMKRTEALIQAAKLKLRLQGLDEKQIDELETTKKNDQALLISSDSRDTWVYATIYEYELGWVKLGQAVRIFAVSYPDKEFNGRIAAIDPVFDAMTRSVRARIKVKNRDNLLKPDMYVDVEIASDFGTHLAVPKEAVMDSGLRKIAFISLGEGRLEAVEVKTGVSDDEYVQVLDGLKEGDIVITSGNFLIDSESKLKSALEGTGHQH